MLLISSLLMLGLCLSLGITRSIKPNLAAVQHIAPAVLTGSTTVTTGGIDLRGFDGAMAIATVGAIAGAGNGSIKLVESDTNLSDYTDVAAADYDNDIAPAGVLITATTYRLGYKGSKRYIGVVFTLNSGTSVALGVVIVKGYPHQLPV